MPIVPLREEEVPFYTHIVADSDMDCLLYTSDAADD